VRWSGRSAGGRQIHRSAKWATRMCTSAPAVGVASATGAVTIASGASSSGYGRVGLTPESRRISTTACGGRYVRRYTSEA
jgi:hypothetical protein